MTKWIKTDKHQWLRETGDGYEMCQIVSFGYLEQCPFFISSGTFSIKDFDKEDIAHAMKSFGYESMDELNRIYGDHAERILAECLFECNMADFDVESFDTLDEALDYANKLMAD